MNLFSRHPLSPAILALGVLLHQAWPTVSAAAEEPAKATTQILHNGIQLPANWPPQQKEWSDSPQRPPYLDAPPAVIPIDVGRQLLFDDFLIAESTLKRVFHQPRYYQSNPILKPDRPWEDVSGRAYAMPFSDGVWFDPQDRKFKMWYYVPGARCYATSTDGVHWEKPDLDVQPGTNIVLRRSGDSSTVWLDPCPRDPGERFKMGLYTRPLAGKGDNLFVLFRSPDGIHWTPVADGGKTGDRTTFFYNPFLDHWVFGIRSGGRLGRSRLYWETKDFFSFSQDVIARKEPVLWTSADKADWPREDLQVQPQLYNLDCAAYESVLLGLFSVWRGDYRYDKIKTDQARQMQQLGRPKQNSICVGFSRDGFHWDRPNRREFLPLSEKMGDWNWGNVQSTAPCCLVVGEELWFYVSGRAGKSFPNSRHEDAGATTGLAMLRRDGFASMDAGAEPGILTTRPLRFRGKHLFVNLNAPEGELRVEVLDEHGQPIASLDRSHCRPLRGNKTRLAVQWEGVADLSAAASKTVRLRFHLVHGSLYAFWATPDPNGASYGFLAGGGPGFHGPQDLPTP